jgi:TPR repeat protein
MYKNHIIEAWKIIGDIYYSGCTSTHIVQNKETAFFWYQSAALAHVSSAQYKVGMMLLDGDGVQADRKRGIDWLSSAAIEGSGEARSYLESIGMSPPPAISPSSYQTYQELARQELIKGQEHDRAAVMHDLGRLAVTTVQLVSEAVLLYSVSRSMTNSAPSATPRVKYVERTRPVYCSVYSQENELFNTVTVNASVFCH